MRKKKKKTNHGRRVMKNAGTHEFRKNPRASDSSIKFTFFRRETEKVGEDFWPETVTQSHQSDPQTSGLTGSFLRTKHLDHGRDNESAVLIRTREHDKLIWRRKPYFGFSKVQVFRVSLFLRDLLPSPPSPVAQSCCSADRRLPSNHESAPSINRSPVLTSRGGCWF